MKKVYIVFSQVIVNDWVAFESKKEAFAFARMQNKKHNGNCFTVKEMSMYADCAEYFNRDRKKEIVDLIYGVCKRIKSGVAEGICILKLANGVYETDYVEMKKIVSEGKFPFKGWTDNYGQFHKFEKGYYGMIVKKYTYMSNKLFFYESLLTKLANGESVDKILELIDKQTKKDSRQSNREERLDMLED